MGRKIAYWGSTAIVGFALLGSLSYLTGNEQVVSGSPRPATRSTSASSSAWPSRPRPSSC